MVAASLVIAATLAGGPWFTGLILMIAGLAALEFTALLARAGMFAMPAVALLAAWALPLGVAHAASGGWLLLWAAVIGGLGWVTIRAARPGALVGWGASLAAGVYVGGLLGSALPLRDHSDGAAWVLLVLAITWACDVTAYLVGRRWGRHRLAPAVSPGKSVEGTVAGIVAASLVGWIGALALAQPAPRLLGMGLLLGIAAVAGDLVESAAKRQLGAKDSGWIMPGHGGMLDRIDSLLFTAFLGYWYVILTDRMGE